MTRPSPPRAVLAPPVPAWRDDEPGVAGPRPTGGVGV